MRSLDIFSPDWVSPTDGFKNGLLGWTAVHAMGSFFKRHHGFGTFHGVVIHWRLSEPLEAAS